MNYDLAVPPCLCRPLWFGIGKGLYLLTFDIASELIGQKGIAMMRQPMNFFRQSIEGWLQIADKPERPRFEARRKTDLIH